MLKFQLKKNLDNGESQNETTKTPLRLCLVIVGFKKFFIKPVVHFGDFNGSRYHFSFYFDYAQQPLKINRTDISIQFSLKMHNGFIK